MRFSLILLALGTLPLLSGAEGGIVSSPFNQRSVPDGETRFTELAPDRTGIVTTNDYDDPRMWRDRHREYALGAMGSGVAIGDYDSDGKPDVFVLSKIESGRLFRNLGNWKFEDVTESSGVGDQSKAWKQGSAFVDVNNDGRLDLYVCRNGVPNQLFVNQGDGTFEDEAAARGLAVVDGSGMACFADYDRDGWIDVYLQTNLLDASASPDGQRDYLFRNAGGGYFENVSDSAGILDQATQGHSATWWDQNEDGWPDLYVANDFGPPDFLYRNNGDGTFTNVIDKTLPHTSFSSMGSDLGDVNNDGHIDFFVADMAGATLEQEHRGQSDSRARLDARQNERQDTAIQIQFNALYLNTGTDRCLEVATMAGLAGTNWTWSTRFEDLDNDGQLDLFVTNGMDREQNNLDIIEKRMAAVNAMGRIGLLKTSPVLKEANLVFENKGDLRFEEVGSEWGLNQKGVSFGAAFGDLDGDGDLDLVYTNYQNGPTVLRNDSQAGNAVIVELRGEKSNRFGLGARLELTTKSGVQVRQLVSARGYLSTSEHVAHFGMGAEDVVESLRIVWPSGTEQVCENLEANRRYLVSEIEAEKTKGLSSTLSAHVFFEEVSSSFGIDTIQREEELEGTIFQPLLPRRFNRRGPGLAVGDLDGDGVDEIILGATALDGVRVFKSDGGRFRELDTGDLGKRPSINGGPPLIFDANGDGANDLLLTAGGAALPAEEPEYEPALWLNDGHGKFARAPVGVLPSLPMSVGGAVAADFDRDGLLDVFLGARLFPGYFPEAPISALLFQRANGYENETRSFAPALEEVGLVTSALASDVDGDGWIDLVVALEWGSPRFFRNQEGRGLVDESEKWGFDTAGDGLWNSIAAADFNSDGRMDFAVGNQGVNTIYRATRAYPMHLFSGKFARGSEPQLVMAFNQEGVLRPVASRFELAAKIPEVLKRFPSNDRFAAATLAEILGEDALAGADVYEVGELRSGVLLSQAKGGYAFVPLPRLAQVSPIQGISAGDFDGDGFSDLLIVNNDFSAIPALGRFDGGLGCLLLGDGAGSFGYVSPDQSGWLVPGNSKALVLTDLDGDAVVDAVLSRSNQSAMAFLNASGRAGVPIALRLHGKAGNPDGIGARVSLMGEGKVLQIAEVYAGGGYASQSSSSLFFTVPAEAADSSSLLIRWPSGDATEVAVPIGGGRLDVSE